MINIRRPLAVGALEGNRICKEGNAELSQTFAKFDQEPPPEVLEQLVRDELVPNVRGQIDDIRELGDSEELNSTLDEADSVLDDLDADPRLLTQGDPFAEVNDDLTALGLDVCAN